MQCRWFNFYGITTLAICKEVTPLIDRIARNTAELSDITFKVAKERIYQRLASSVELSDITFKVAKERIYQRLLFVLQALWNSRISRSR
jgi:metal-dependent amidase/aminoacylase/carboxypeptidase family protein